MPKANLTRGNSITENYQPEDIDCMQAAINQIIDKYPAYKIDIVRSEIMTFKRTPLCGSDNCTQCQTILRRVS